MDRDVIGGYSWRCVLGRRGSKEQQGYPSDTTATGDPHQGRDTPEDQQPMGDTQQDRDTPELSQSWVTYARAWTPPRLSFGKRF